MRNDFNPNQISFFDSLKYRSIIKRESKRLRHIYNNIISVENLLISWREFLRGKKKRKDVAVFSVNFMDNIISLHNNLANQTYKHGGYEAFKINDPKPRDIHKASVRDRLLHHALYRILYHYFDKKFIADSFSCRLNKGTHKAIKRFEEFSHRASRNNTRTCWVLKCDIRKFFANINHNVLTEILKEYIDDDELLWLLGEVIGSFASSREETGLPLGNLTSQLFVNIYMNKFDQFVKHKLKAEYYIRYCDDFIILSQNRDRLINFIPAIQEFLQDALKLELHPDKISIKTVASGIDFLGWVNFTDHIILRTSTKRRMMRKIKENFKEESANSYLGLLKHGNAHKLERSILLFLQKLA